jgi:hypothetical protein
MGEHRQVGYGVAVVGMAIGVGLLAWATGNLEPRTGAHTRVTAVAFAIFAGSGFLLDAVRPPGSRPSMVRSAPGRALALWILLAPATLLSLLAPVWQEAFGPGERSLLGGLFAGWLFVSYVGLLVWSLAAALYLLGWLAVAALHRRGVSDERLAEWARWPHNRGQ